jgi:DNA topoisomerase-3
LGKRLVIAEKPSVGRDIAATLGGFVDHDEYLESDDWIVTWALGHLLELAEPEEYDKALRSWSIKLLPIIPETFQVRPKEGQKKRLDLIQKLGARKDVDGLVNACDAGREGELIFRRIVAHTGLSGKPTERLWLQSMTAGAIRTAFTQLLPGSQLDRLADAAWLRAVGDWLVGMNATRALTQRLKSRGEQESWSAGRVQTPTLALMVRREREIQAHIPRVYWEISATFHRDGAGTPAATHSWQGRCWDGEAKARASASGEDEADHRPTRLFDRARVDAVLAALAQPTSVVASEKRRKSKQAPPLLFDLTSLQRESNRRFTLSAKRTLDAAQRLYEQHKLLTYPRTDSRYLPADYADTVRATLDALATHAPATATMGDIAPLASAIASAGPLQLDRNLDGAKVSDHFAIIPTGNPPTTQLSGDDARVYELVVRQFLAAWMGPATWSQVERTVVVRGPSPEPFKFRTQARTLDIPGFLAALGQEADDETPLPPLVPGQDEVDGLAVGLERWSDDQKETRPPPRYSEAQLLRMMETAGEQVDQEELSDAMRGRGLGTPATRAETIEKLVGALYIRRLEGKLAPTSKAMRVMDVLERADAGALTSPKLTGEWQFALDQVEHGLQDRAPAHEALVQYTRSIVQSLAGFDHDALYAADPSVGTCPACGGAVQESAWGYRCRNNTGAGSACAFMVWKDRAGRYIDRDLVRRLLAERTVADVDGFVDRSGRRALTGTLKLDFDQEKGRWTVQTVFGASSVAGEEVVGAALFDCPCGNEGCSVIETNQRYVCRRVLEGVDRVGPTLPKSVCSREIAVEEAEVFFSAAAKTVLLENFISKRNRPFKGYLVRKPNGKYGFEFPEREGQRATEGAPARKGRRAAEAVDSAPKRGRAGAAGKAATAAPKKAAPAAPKKAATPRGAGEAEPAVKAKAKPKPKPKPKASKSAPEPAVDVAAAAEKGSRKRAKTEASPATAAPAKATARATTAKKRTTPAAGGASADPAVAAPPADSPTDGRRIPKSRKRSAD